MTTSVVTPFIKWAGGKQALALKLIPSFPADFRRYFEPFLGGGSVAFGLGLNGAVLSDANAWLVDTYKGVRDNWRQVAAILDTLVNTKREYLKYRAIDPFSLQLSERAALFIYLNKTGFRGLFRVNAKGRFNVPYGAYQRRYYDARNLEECANVLRRSELRVGDFEAGLKGVSKGDFVYLDPPYYKLGGYSDFNRYTPGKFRSEDHVRLAAACKKLDARGVKWALSNSDTEFVRGLYRGFRATRLASRREINLKSTKRDMSELLITNYEKSAIASSELSPTHSWHGVSVGDVRLR